ncbi:MAG: glycosyltransferase family 4 protein [Deltaproteobacteria bacterium]|nr:glycosyltransferase family 4 protein [Deltaproteobacteria bacterium]
MNCSETGKTIPRMNVLIVMHGAGSGGVEKSLRTLCRYCSKEKFRLIVALPSEGPLKRYLDELNIKIVITSIDTWTPIPFHFGERHYFQFLSNLEERISALVEIINKENIDIVHSSTLSVADGAFAAKIAGVPHLWHIHGKSVGTTNAYGSYLPIETLYALVENLSTEIIAVSNDARNFLKKYLPWQDVRVIYNGIDIEETDRLSAGPSLIRDEFKLHKKKLVSLVGRIAEVKGIEDYVEAASRVLKDRDDVAFLVIGSDEDKELTTKIQSRIEALSLSDRIIFTGRRNDVPEILHQTDVFVCSSKTEGFPYSVLEAMAAQKPVVTTRCGGPEEIVVDGTTGFHVGVRRSAEMALALLRLLDDDQLARKMGLKGRELVEQKFSAEMFAKCFEETYMRILDKKRQETPNPWTEVLLELTSTVGNLGTRTRHLENEVRDLRSFEGLFKNNFVYRGLRNLLRR